MTIKVRDIASGKIRELPSDTPAVWFGGCSTEEKIEARNSGILKGDYSYFAMELSDLSPGEECLIEGDESPSDETSVWWLSEVLG